MKCNIVFRIYEDSHVLTLERKEVWPGKNGTFAFSEGDCEGSLEWKESFPAGFVRTAPGRFP